MTDQFYVELTGLKQLREFHFPYATTDDTVEAVVGKCLELRVVDVSGTAVKGKFVECLKELARLEVLVIRGFAIGRNLFDKVGELSGIGKLVLDTQPRGRHFLEKAAMLEVKGIVAEEVEKGKV